MVQLKDTGRSWLAAVNSNCPRKGGTLLKFCIRAHKPGGRQKLEGLVLESDLGLEYFSSRVLVWGLYISRGLDWDCIHLGLVWGLN